MSGYLRRVAGRSAGPPAGVVRPATVHRWSHAPTADPFAGVDGSPGDATGAGAPAAPARRGWGSGARGDLDATLRAGKAGEPLRDGGRSGAWPDGSGTGGGAGSRPSRPGEVSPATGSPAGTVGADGTAVVAGPPWTSRGARTSRSGGPSGPGAGVGIEAGDGAGAVGGAPAGPDPTRAGRAATATPDRGGLRPRRDHGRSGGGDQADGAAETGRPTVDPTTARARSAGDDGPRGVPATARTLSRSPVTAMGDTGDTGGRAARAARMLAAPVPPARRPAPSAPAAAARTEIVIGRITVVVDAPRPAERAPRPARPRPPAAPAPGSGRATGSTELGGGFAHRFGLGQL